MEISGAVDVGRQPVMVSSFDVGACGCVRAAPPSASGLGVLVVVSVGVTEAWPS